MHNVRMGRKQRRQGRGQHAHALKQLRQLKVAAKWPQTSPGHSIDERVTQHPNPWYSPRDMARAADDRHLMASPRLLTTEIPNKGFDPAFLGGSCEVVMNDMHQCW